MKRDWQREDAAVEVVPLQQCPDHVGASARPAIDGRRWIGCQPQCFDIEHEGIAAALKSAAHRRQRIDVRGNGKWSKDLLAGQYPRRCKRQSLERFADALARRRRSDEERRFQPIGLLAREVVVVVAPVGSQRRVVQAAVRQDGLRVQQGQPLERRHKVDELHAHGRGERQRRGAGVRADGDVEFAVRTMATKLTQHRRQSLRLPLQSPVALGNERIQPHVVVDDPHHRAGPPLGEGVEIGLQHGSRRRDGKPASRAHAATGN